MSVNPATCTCDAVPEEELLARLDEVIADYREKPGALIPVLQIAQGIFGYLPEVALKRIAVGLDKPFSEVAGVVGFYSFFSTQPRGRHLIRVCLGTACYVRGGKQVLDALKQKLKCDVGDTTADRNFTLEVARCFGACGLAPAVMIDDDVHQRVKPARLQAILDQYAAPADVPPGHAGGGDGIAQQSLAGAGVAPGHSPLPGHAGGGDGIAQQSLAGAGVAPGHSNVGGE